PAADVPASALADAPAALPATPTPEATLGPTSEPTGPPPGTNPLTGLPVREALLVHPPLLVTVSNETEAVRPWSGLSMADHVWEAQIEGLARTSLTAVFLSHAPTRVGAVRGAHLIDLDELVPMYHGVLVTAGGSTNGGAGGPPRIVELLAAAPWAERVISPERGFAEPYLTRIADFPTAGVSFWNTVFADAAAVWRWARGEGFTAKDAPAGLAFAAEAPRGGKITRTVLVDYPQFGPKREWVYDEARGRWLSSTDDVPDSDTLAEGQLAFDNVVILF
ncbi:MAG: DUF3048 domain-containing protein, partial [Gammaproteobacteria bacterium]|nr:DUF3048 domain-containing protein [Gammaproteobacteria bacterium]